MTHRHLEGMRSLVLFFALIATICIVGKLIERARWAGPIPWTDEPAAPNENGPEIQGDREGDSIKRENFKGEGHAYVHDQL